jgi:hypothetical protein
LGVIFGAPSHFWSQTFGRKTAFAINRWCPCAGMPTFVAPVASTYASSMLTPIAQVASTHASIDEVTVDFLYAAVALAVTDKWMWLWL